MTFIFWLAICFGFVTLLVAAADDISNLPDIFKRIIRNSADDNSDE
jgi:hypothetical protein